MPSSPESVRRTCFFRQCTVQDVMWIIQNTVENRKSSSLALSINSAKDGKSLEHRQERLARRITDHTPKPGTIPESYFVLGVSPLDRESPSNLVVELITMLTAEKVSYTCQ